MNKTRDQLETLARERAAQLAVANQSLEASQARLAAIVQSSDDAIIGKTLEGIIISWNHGAEKIFGYPASEVIGTPMLKLFPPELVDEEAKILACLSRGESVDHYETVRVRKDGRRINVSVTVSPIRDGSGRIIGASKVARDITERKQVEGVIESIKQGKRGFARRAG